MIPRNDDPQPVILFTHDGHQYITEGHPETMFAEAIRVGYIRVAYTDRVETRHGFDVHPRVAFIPTGAIAALVVAAGDTTFEPAANAGHGLGNGHR